MNIDDKELERDIENAFRARGLKEAMQQWDIEAKGERRKNKRLPSGKKIAEPFIHFLQ